MSWRCTSLSNGSMCREPLDVGARGGDVAPVEGEVGERAQDALGDLPQLARARRAPSRVRLVGQEVAAVQPERALEAVDRVGLAARGTPRARRPRGRAKTSASTSTATVSRSSPRGRSG